MTDREFLRHAVATVSYRAAKALRDAPATFSDFRAGESSRSAVEILAHMGDLFDWALSMASGSPKWNNATPQAWESESARFFQAVSAFDAFLASNVDTQYELPRLFQGPVADALTHVGQLTMLRRLHGAHVRSESFNRAEITIGRVGPEQVAPDPRYEFD